MGEGSSKYPMLSKNFPKLNKLNELFKTFNDDYKKLLDEFLREQEKTYAENKELKDEVGRLREHYSQLEHGIKENEQNNLGRHSKLEAEVEYLLNNQELLKQEINTYERKTQILSSTNEFSLSRLDREKRKGFENEHKLKGEISNLKIEIERADAKFIEVEKDYETLNSRYKEQQEKLKDLRLQLHEKSSVSVDSKGRQEEKPYRTSVTESEKITGQAQVCVNYGDFLKEKSDHLANDFLQLYEHYWKSAMTELRESGDENTNIEFLLTILKKAYSFSEHMEKGLRGDFEQALLHASKHIKEVVDTTLLVREILEEQLTGCMKELFLRDPRFKEYGTKGPAVQSYISEAVSICWLMVTRSPRVIISTTIPKESHSDSFNPYRKFGSKVDFVVWPVVKLSNDEGEIVCRGTAVFK
ncbi:uncharacterized protein LOC143043287 [Mytilus galloprovincialis]|uniref:uncharacterized protein LOC143043287 n=1 Tax=Mytilus galloprovincialis TaxID=29158 RepID=UPI003F7BE4E7